MEITSCSLCGSENAESIVVLRDYGYTIPGQFPLVRCQDCGLLYLTPRPKPENMEHYYPESYTPYKTAIEDESWALMRWVRRRNIGQYRRIVEKYTPVSRKKILDVGCSTGIFLAEMRSTGWQTQGIELSTSAAQYAQERFGLDISAGRLTEVYQTIRPESLSAATMWDVLEHTYDPLQTLRILNTRLMLDGIVVLTIPHWESLDRKLFGHYWIGYDAPRHLHVFTRAILKKLLDQAGYEILRMRCSFGGYYSTLPSLKHWGNSNISSQNRRRILYRFLEIPGLRYITLPYDIMLDVLGLGNKLLIIAKKNHSVELRS